MNHFIQKLKAVSDTPRLEYELLLMHLLRISRAALLAKSSIELTAAQEKQLNDLIERRLKGEPMAYLLGEKEFWSLCFEVTPDVLIPRPETECLVEYILSRYQNESHLKIADLGTGSGAISIALAHEKPLWHVQAVDISEKALAVAKRNAQRHQLKNITFYPGHFCEGLPEKDYNIIVSNPPYIEANDPHLSALVFEPPSALVSGETGLEAIETILNQATAYLKPGGLLIIEHGYNQAESVVELFHQAGFIHIETHRDLAGQPRFTLGEKDYVENNREAIE